MRWSLGFPKVVATLLAAATTMTTLVSAEDMLISTSLNTCQKDSQFTARKFDVVYTPGNNSASIEMLATSSISGKVVFDLEIVAYGLDIIRTKVDPCDDAIADLKGLCPMTVGEIPIAFPIPVPDGAADQLPSITYGIPDLDANVKVRINTSSTETVACVEARISNGKTVDLLGVKWATAIIAILTLSASAVVNGLGHSNAASHIASNSLSLFGYFQSQAMIGLTSVKMPPIVQGWTQDFQWSMGIIHVDFLQSMVTWYQRATGGEPTDLFNDLRDVSVQVAKRSMSVLAKRGADMMKRGLSSVGAGDISHLAKRDNIESENGGYIVYGIQRAAFKAGIETTNLVLTGLTFFIILVLIVSLAVAAFKGITELFAKKGWMNHDKFLDFRNGWLTVLKGILFRICLIGLPQLCILCLWEFTQIDSPAVVVLAVFFLFSVLGTLGWGAFKVISMARRSIAMHRNPAYILYADPAALNKFGFLYIQFRASAYYFIVPTVAYTVVKALFIAFGQHSGIAQAIGILIVEAAALIAATVLRPWMDKTTNSFNIAICAVNFINAIFILIFSDVFGAPGLVIGVVGVVLFVLNAAFSLILLLIVIISTAIIFFRSNPDAKYRLMADDRTSFMKSQTQLNTTTELDALAATARGDKYGHTSYGDNRSQSRLDLDDDHASLSSESVRPRPMSTMR